MNKFIDTVNSISPREIKIIEKEVYESKKNKNSCMLNTILQENKFNSLKEEYNKSIILIFDILEELIKNAVILKKDKITRSWINFFKAIDKLIKMIYKNENTSEKIFTKIRKIIKDKYNDDSEIYKKSIYIMGMSQERSIQKKKEYSLKVKDAGMNRNNLKPIYDDEIYEIIKKGISSSKIFDKIIAVMLACGSRSVEVMRVSNYSKTDNDNFIEIKNIAKNNDNKIIVRPLIYLKADQVIKTVNHIRKYLLLKERTNEQLTSSYNTTLNKSMKKLFSDDSLTSHKCRYIASNLAYLLYGKDSTPNIYIQQYLGHKNGNTSRTYQSINVKLRGLTPCVTKNQNDLKVPYSEYINPRVNTGLKFKLELLTSLMKKLKDDNIYLKQKEIKAQYNYGSKILTEFYKKIKAGEIVI